MLVESMNPTISEILCALEKDGHKTDSPVTGRTYVDGVDVTRRLEKTQHDNWLLTEVIEYLTMENNDE